MKDVSIIIPAITWEFFTEQCVTICSALFPESEIILVIDDDSRVKTSLKNLTIIKQGGTIARKRNTGVRAAKTNFIAFIDSDAFPNKDWLSSAIETLNTDESVGMVGGPNISPLSQEPQRNLVGMATKSWLVAGKWNFYKSENSTARYCDNLPSCNLVLHRQLFEQLNGMNEALEVGEDTDFCARIIAGGYRVYFNPKAIVYHYDRKIVPYLLQRIVRGAGVFELISGSSAQKKNPYTYLLLQPVFTILFWMSFPFGVWWHPWFYIMATVGAVYFSLILLEAYKCSTQWRLIPTVAALILAGNILPGAGFILKALGLLPSLNSFYRNDQS